MVSIGTPKPAPMPRHPADHTTAGRQRWESHDEGKWSATFGTARRKDSGRTIKRWRADGTSYVVHVDAPTTHDVAQGEAHKGKG